MTLRAPPKSLAPALWALAGVPMYLDAFYNLSDSVEPTPWLYCANRVADRCGEAMDQGWLGVDKLERLGDAIAFETERLARGLDPAPDSMRVRAFVLQALSDIVAFSRTNWSSNAEWLEYVGVTDLAANLATELERHPYRTLARERDVTTAVKTLFSFWRDEMERVDR